MKFTKNFRMVLCAISIILAASEFLLFDCIGWGIFDSLLALYWASTLNEEQENG